MKALNSFSSAVMARGSSAVYEAGMASDCRVVAAFNSSA
jgi:hypothetical protein